MNAFSRRKNSLGLHATCDVAVRDLVSRQIGSALRNASIVIRHVPIPVEYGYDAATAPDRCFHVLS
jgi:hypothetical protein